MARWKWQNFALINWHSTHSILQVRVMLWNQEALMLRTPSRRKRESESTWIDRRCRADLLSTCEALASHDHPFWLSTLYHNEVLQLTLLIAKGKSTRLPSIKATPSTAATRKADTPFCATLLNPQKRSFLQRTDNLESLGPRGNCKVKKSMFVL